MNFKLFLFSLLFLFQDLFCSNLFCQNLTFDKVGGQIGLSCSIGTHTQRLGLIGRFFYNWQFLQLNLQSSFIYNYKSLGSCKKGWEMSIQPGIAGIWGKKNLFGTFFFLVFNFTSSTVTPIISKRAVNTLVSD